MACLGRMTIVCLGFCYLLLLVYYFYAMLLLVVLGLVGRLAALFTFIYRFGVLAFMSRSCL